MPACPVAHNINTDFQFIDSVDFGENRHFFKVLKLAHPRNPPQIQSANLSLMFSELYTATFSGRIPFLPRMFRDATD
jgi:hypothetical protein